MPEKVDYGVRVLLGSDGIYELHLQPSDVSHAIQTSNTVYPPANVSFTARC